MKLLFLILCFSSPSFTNYLSAVKSVIHKQPPIAEALLFCSIVFEISEKDTVIKTILEKFAVFKGTKVPSKILYLIVKF